MIAKYSTVIVCLILAISAQGVAEFEFGGRPPLSVFDPAGFLKPTELKEISDPLASIYQREGVDVIVIVLTDLGGAPPEHVAGRFAAAWCKSPIHCVVLHVPGSKGAPWIVPGGRLIEALSPDQIRKTVGDASRRAALEPKEPDKIAAAATEAADMLRYWMANAINRSELILTEATRMRVEQETKSRQWKISMMVAAASFIPVTIGLWLLASFLRSRGPGMFPEYEPEFRLGAPHAGGNHAEAELGPPLP